jgi:hypothetical protein
MMIAANAMKYQEKKSNQCGWLVFAVRQYQVEGSCTCHESAEQCYTGGSPSSVHNRNQKIIPTDQIPEFVLTFQLNV